MRLSLHVQRHQYLALLGWNAALWSLPAHWHNVPDPLAQWVRAARHSARLTASVEG